MRALGYATSWYIFTHIGTSWHLGTELNVHLDLFEFSCTSFGPQNERTFSMFFNAWRFLHKQQLEMGGLLKRLKCGAYDSWEQMICSAACVACVARASGTGPLGKSWNALGRWRWNACCNVTSSIDFESRDFQSSFYESGIFACFFWSHTLDWRIIFLNRIKRIRRIPQ